MSLLKTFEPEESVGTLWLVRHTNTSFLSGPSGLLLIRENVRLGSYGHALNGSRRGSSPLLEPVRDEVRRDRDDLELEFPVKAY